MLPLLGFYLGLMLPTQLLRGRRPGLFAFLFVSLRQLRPLGGMSLVQRRLLSRMNAFQLVRLRWRNVRHPLPHRGTENVYGGAVYAQRADRGWTVNLVYTDVWNPQTGRTLDRL
jgi:hypothetical protein